MLDPAFVTIRDQTYATETAAYRAVWAADPTPDENRRMWAHAEADAKRQLGS